MQLITTLLHISCYRKEIDIVFLHVLAQCLGAYRISGHYCIKRHPASSHSVGAQVFQRRFLDREHRYLASFERIRRSPIDDSFAESFSTPNSPIWFCAHMRTKSPRFSPDTHPSNQAEMGARSPDLSASLSFLFFLWYLPFSSFSFSLPTLRIVLCLELDPYRGRSSLEKCIGWRRTL